MLAAVPQGFPSRRCAGECRSHATDTGTHQLPEQCQQVYERRQHPAGVLLSVRHERGTSLCGRYRHRHSAQRAEDDF